MSENVPTTDEAARAEAEASYPASLAITRYERAAFIHGWNSHAVWQLSHPVEVTDEMVERVAKAVDDHGTFGRVHEGAWREYWCWCDSGEDWSPEHVARAVLRAALEGETE